MTKKSIYLKYREERDYAKYLKEFKKNTWQIKKVARVRLERVDLNALMKKKQSVPVSLPIKYFNNIRSNMSNNQDGKKELQIPKDEIGRIVRQDVRPIAPTTNLRMVRHQVVAAQHDTTASTTTINSIPIKPNLIPVNLTLPATRDAEKESEKVETYTPTNAMNTAAKVNMMPFQRNDQISMKITPTKENYGTAHRKVSSLNSKEVETNNPTDIIDTAAKANVMALQRDDHININHPNYSQEINTPVKQNVMPYGTAQRKMSFTNSKEAGTNTSTDIIDTGEISNDHISIKHKLPVPVAPSKENYGMAHRENSYINVKDVETNTPTDAINTAAKYTDVNSANEVKTCLKVSVITSTQTDNIHTVNETELEILGIVTKSGVTNDELVDALESFKKVKELSKFNVTEVIDLDDLADDTSNGANLLELARFHSEKNKKAIYKNCVPVPNLSSTKSAPTPIDLERQKVLGMRYKLINSLNYEQLKNLIDSQDKTNNKENSNKKRKTTESSDNYDEANMEMEIDVPDTKSIMNQPVTAASIPKPSLQKSTTQQRQVLPINAQNQNKQTNMPQIYSTPIQQIICKDANLESLQHQKMQQQQYLQELKQQNMRGKPKPPQQQQNLQLKNPLTQQPSSKSPQIQELYSQNQQFQQAHSKTPQIPEHIAKCLPIQEPHSKSPQDLQSQSQATELQEQLQHPLDRRIRIRDQQRAALPQQHYQYESANNGYQNPVFLQVPQTVNSTQRPQFQLYPGDPRIQTFQSQMSQIMPRAPRLMSTYEANLQTSSSSYPYQNNGYNNQQYW